MDPFLVPILSLWLMLAADPLHGASWPASFPAPDEVPLLSGADGDSDGVPDVRDVCPETPEGYPITANGCSRDSDGDGVSDGADRCPGTAPGSFDIDSRGCSEKDRKMEWSHRAIVRPA